MDDNVGDSHTANPECCGAFNISNMAEPNFGGKEKNCEKRQPPLIYSNMEVISIAEDINVYLAKNVSWNQRLSYRCCFENYIVYQRKGDRYLEIEALQKHIEEYIDRLLEDGCQNYQHQEEA